MTSSEERAEDFFSLNLLPSWMDVGQKEMIKNHQYVGFFDSSVSVLTHWHANEIWPGPVHMYFS